MIDGKLAAVAAAVAVFVAIGAGQRGDEDRLRPVPDGMVGRGRLASGFGEVRCSHQTWLMMMTMHTDHEIA